MNLGHVTKWQESVRIVHMDTVEGNVFQLVSQIFYKFNNIYRICSNTSLSENIINIIFL